MSEGFVPWGTLAGAKLDPPVRPLVESLNRSAWARTVFSCAGHPEEAEAGVRGRRQAHVDALVADPARWRAFVRRTKREAPAAVAALNLPDVTLRVVDGSLGAPPDWLRAALRGEDVSRRDRRGAPWWRLLLPDALTAATDPAGRRWRYRRLVLEPVPYDLEPETCRRALDAALGAARSVLAAERSENG